MIMPCKSVGYLPLFMFDERLFARILNIGCGRSQIIEREFKISPEYSSLLYEGRILSLIL